MTRAAQRRALILAVALLLLAALGWSLIGELDVVATGEGRVLPAARVKRIQPPEAGRITAIHVEEGQRVAAAAPLVELDTALRDADRERLANALLANRAEAARLRALTGPLAQALTSFAMPPGLPTIQGEDHRALLAAEIAEHEARLAALDLELRRLDASARASVAIITKLERAAPLLGERAAARRFLAHHGHGSRLAFLEIEQLRIEREQDLIEQRARLAEIQAMAEAQRAQHRRADSEFRHRVHARLVEAERLGVSLAQELAKAEQHLAYHRLAAPIAGTVHQLAVHTLGGVVNAGETLMLIVPDDDALEIEALMPNRDIGFLRARQLAQIRLEAFPYTTYGTLAGSVRDIGRDAIDDPRLGLVFPVRIALARRALRVGEQDVALVAGMRATVDIVTERRRVIEFLLAPLLRLRNESLRER
jgi:hemolysin D